MTMSTQCVNTASLHLMAQQSIKAIELNGKFAFIIPWAERMVIQIALGKTW